MATAEWDAAQPPPDHVRTICDKYGVRETRELPAGGMATGKQVETLCRERGLIIRRLAPGNMIAIAPPHDNTDRRRKAT